jgi:hypothetical protein
MPTGLGMHISRRIKLISSGRSVTVDVTVLYSPLSYNIIKYCDMTPESRNSEIRGDVHC